MTLPSGRHWLFSIKTFAAAIMALAVAEAAALPRPYWAMATVYICSQPLSGATRSKAVYRVVGTLIGAVVAVAIVPGLTNAPVLFVGAMAGWIGLCLYFSLLDRSPRSYTFMLAGYTAALIGFPAVLDPGAIFDTALARVEEITLGIVFASLVSSLAWPSSVGAATAERANAWLGNAARLTLDALAGQGATDRARRELVRLAGDAADLDLLSSHLPYDTSGMGDVRDHVEAIRWRMLALLPVLSSIVDRVDALRDRDGLLPAAIRPAVAGLEAWINPGPLTMAATDQNRERDEAERLRAVIEAATPRWDRHADWTALLTTSLLLRLRELLDIASDIRVLRRAARTRRRVLNAALAYEPGVGHAPIRHRDHAMALWSAAATALAIVLCCLFWIESGWPDGSAAPMMAAVACCFFAARDDPAPAILQFAHGTLIAVGVMAVYLFALLPMVHDFEMLVLVMAPTFLVFGLLIANPRTAGIGLALAANGATILALQSTFSADFASYANSNLALLLGMYAGALVIRLTRSVGAEWAIWRLISASRATMARAAVGRGARDRNRFAALLLDRIGLIAPRLGAIAPGSEADGIDLMGGLRVGLNVIDLRRARSLLPAAAEAAVGDLLALLGARFRTRYRKPTARLLEQIDRTLAAVAPCDDGPAKRDALLGLVGIRRVLFPEASPYRAQQPEAPVPERAAA